MATNAESLEYSAALVPGTTQFNSRVSTAMTLGVSQNTFAYNSRTLFIAYGSSILLSAVCLACGLAALKSNGASYTNHFSTILRMTRDRRFGEFIQDEEDCAGTDPLPKDLAHVEVTYVIETEGRGEKSNEAEGFISGIKVLGQV
jgi:hypothetical protein